MPKKNKNLTPQNANTLSKICKLDRDHVETASFWFMVHEKEVTIAHQGVGAACINKMSIPKKDFNKFVKFYLGE